MICWVPLYTINCINFFCSNCLVDPKLTNFCIILSHLNSALNPVLYAYHLRDFRKALRNAIFRMCGMTVPQDQLRATNSLSMISYHQSMLMDRRTPSQRRIYSGSLITLQPKCSPSPRSRFSTHSYNTHTTCHRPGLPSSLVNLTVAPRCNIWQVVQENSSRQDQGGGATDAQHQQTSSPLSIHRVRFNEKRRISGRPLSNSSNESGVSLSSAPDTESQIRVNHNCYSTGAFGTCFNAVALQAQREIDTLNNT